jgi:hypothetical protein
MGEGVWEVERGRIKRKKDQKKGVGEGEWVYERGGEFFFKIKLRKKRRVRGSERDN